MTRKIPYGIADYGKIKEQNMLYVDKTKYIETLEGLNSPYPVYLRPRRFGKTLLVSMLAHYYDRNNQDHFEELFGDTYIGSHPTELAGRYYVMRFNFSAVSSDNVESLIHNFRKEVEDTIVAFEHAYSIGAAYDKGEKNAARLLGSYLTNIYPITKKKVYIMVDEYDHFANNLLHDKEAFREVTGKDGFVRQFYEILKVHTESGCIDRIFITGVTSLTLDSLTSGFNIAKNVSMLSRLNEMTGFTKEEVYQLLEEQRIEEATDVFQVLESNYNGYLFCPESKDDVKRVFNSNMVLYFLDGYQMSGKIPRNLVDTNIQTDYNKLTGMFELFEDEEKRKQILEEIMEDQGLETDIVSNFNFSISFSESDFLSMLFYLGLLTIKEEGSGFDAVLQTPNAVIRNIYYQYYANYLKIDNNQKVRAVRSIAQRDDFTDLNAMIVDVLKMHSNEDYKKFNEARLKSIVLSCYSNQTFYLVKSEYETSGRRIDIALFSQYGKAHEVRNNYLIELKYMKKSDANESSIAALKDEAIKQMKDYLQLEEFRVIPNLKGYIYVVVKNEIVVFEEVKNDECVEA